jgi:hypothetical protein
MSELPKFVNQGCASCNWLELNKENMNQALMNHRDNKTQIAGVTNPNKNKSCHIDLD